MSLFFRCLAGLCLTLCALSVHATAPANSANPELLTRPWKASWIGHPSASLTNYGVFHFRKEFNLATPPSHFVVHVSADNRYRLFVNGTSVSVGPSRGDPLHWQFETIDLAPHLKTGRNVIAAVVWNQGPHKPVAQMSVRSSFLLFGDTEAEASVSTGPGWLVYQNPGYSPLPLPTAELHTYIVIGASEEIDASRQPWGWEQPGFDASTWIAAADLGQAYPHGTGTGSNWLLTPRITPLPEEHLQRLSRVRRAEGSTPPEKFLEGNSAWSVPAHTTATVLLDQGFETTAYPELLVSGGRGAQVEIHYAEALVDPQRQKGNRNEIEGRSLIGYFDRYHADGSPSRLYSPLWYRTFRYIELRIKTADTPLTVHDFRARFTAYPFEEKGRFSSDDPSLKPIWEVGWRTARLCAFETYMDCPYYEQLQYVGDTRIQALISLYVSGDDRLMRNAIRLYDRSRISEGLTQSRFPSSDPQVINTFSLFWIDMIHDYWLHRDDEAFVKSLQPGVESVIHWFQQRIDPRTGLLGRLPYWTFVDWPDEWAWNSVAQHGGVPEGASEGGSSIVTLQLAISLRHAADLVALSGETGRANAYRRQADDLISAVKKHCWDPERKYFSDSPQKKAYSQHANTFAVLADAVSGEEARDLIARTAADPKLIQATQYFGFYVLRALKHAGLGDRYIESLKPWRGMIANGLTTFAERQDPTRSDCHAWSASPNYELLATVCGIEPAAPGFKRVRIEPHLGPLHHVEGLVPHPAGNIEMTLTLTPGTQGGEASITLPSGVSGEFVWKGKTQSLHSGTQSLRF